MIIFRKKRKIGPEKRSKDKGKSKGKEKKEDNKEKKERMERRTKINKKVKINRNKMKKMTMKKWMYQTSAHKLSKLLAFYAYLVKL